MANNRIINLRSGWLYEKADHQTPTSFTTVSEGATFAAGETIFRVIADAPQYDALAYTIQRTNESGNYEDVYNIRLNVPDGSGTTRTDCFHSVSHNNPIAHTQFQSQTTVEKGAHHTRVAFDQQVSLERSLGIVFAYQGNLFRGIWSGNTETTQLEEGGLLEAYDVTLTSSRLQWANASMRPIVGATIINNGKRYKIENLVTLGSAYEFGLMKKQ
jgi:hypothetical protein